MRSRILFLAGAVALAAAVPASAATYYVSATGKDTNAGNTAATALLTIGAAAARTNPGDTVLIMNGTYGPFTISRSGTAAAAITYKPGPGQHPVLRKDGTAWAGITETANYITLAGLEVLGNAQSITIDQANKASRTDSTVNGHCVSVPATAHHVTITGMILSYCPGAGIMFLGDYGWIYKNAIHHNAFWSPYDTSGIVLGGANPLATPGRIYVYDNVVYNNMNYEANRENTYDGPVRVTDGNGIIVDSNMNSHYAGRIEIYNNIVYYNGGHGIQIGPNSQHVDVYNNTLYKNTQSSTQPAPYTAFTGGGEIVVAAVDDVRVENNIQYGLSSVPQAISYRTATHFTWDYNIMFGNLGGNTVYGPHDIIADPMFTTWLQPPAAFNVQEGSPAFANGTGALVPVDDFDGKLRYPARIDRGAYRVDW